MYLPAEARSLGMGLGPQVLNWGGRMEGENIMLDKAEFISMRMCLYYSIYILAGPGS